MATRCPADDHENIDDSLRSWLCLASRCRAELSPSGYDAAECSERLLAGSLFDVNPEYVRTQIVYSLLQEDEAGALYVIASFLLLDGRRENAVFRSMVGEGCFHRLLDLIDGRRDQEDPGLHRLMLELLYEMSRIERLRTEDLMHVHDGLVTYLFQLIEGLSDDAHDPYHYTVIRVLVSVGPAESTSDDADVGRPSWSSTSSTWWHRRAPAAIRRRRRRR